MAAAAPAAPGPGAVQTYTLDYNADNEVVINGVAGIDDSSKRPLASLPSLSGNIYANVNQLIQDQKTLNYLDALKDGTNKHQLDALEIYDGINLSFSALHPHENKLLSRNKSRILRTTWLKTKKNSKMNLIDVQNVFWEAGLGYQPFIYGRPNEIVTFGSYIDPLTKPGEIWPRPNHKIYITPSFMNAFGFGPSSLWAITRNPELITKSSGNAFHYEININCGMGCGDKLDTCKLAHNPATASKDRKNNIVDENNVYFKGNEAKNAIVNAKAESKTITSADKTKLIVAKGWGDKVQVMMYYMYYYIVSKNTIMITCDLVVFCFCMILGIPCVYTGVYDRNVDIPYNPYNDLSLGGSFFSILHFKPGSPMENAVMNYQNTIKKIEDENNEFIINITTLMKNFNTGIEVGELNPMTFQEVFYNLLYADMTRINTLLVTERERIPGNVDEIINKTQELKKIFLIVPMFKYTGKDKIRFLQTKWYTSDKNITLNHTVIGGTKKNDTFLQFAKTNHNSKYDSLPNPKRMKGGETEKERIIRVKREEIDRKNRERLQVLQRAERQKHGVIRKILAEDEKIAYDLYMANNSLKLNDTGKSLFPNRDTEEKIFRSCPGDMNDIKHEYNDVQELGKKKANQYGAELFLFDDPDDVLNEQNQPLNNFIDVQDIFNKDMSIAIYNLKNGGIDTDDEKAGPEERANPQNRANPENRAEYLAAHNNQEGGHRRNTTRRRQKGGGVDETLFETLYTLYVYRAQYDIELDTHDRSINMTALSELYEDYPKSEIQPNRNNTLRRVKGGPVTGKPATGTTGLNYYVQGKPSVIMSKLVTGMTLENMRKQPIHAQTRKRVRNNSGFGQPISGGRITRRKKRYHRRTRK